VHAGSEGSRSRPEGLFFFFFGLTRYLSVCRKANMSVPRRKGRQLNSPVFLKINPRRYSTS